MEYMFAPLRKYGIFSGRARRQEYWMFFLFQMIVNFGFIGFGVVLRYTFGEAGIGIIALVWLIWFLAMIVPNVAVIIRRMHDQNIPGWVGGLLYASILLFSFLSCIVILIFMCIEGRRGPNQYGEDPKEIQAAQDIFA
jgi:uncharacterized membrane protein YhaH (DUF805 family)